MSQLDLARDPLLRRLAEIKAQQPAARVVRNRRGREVYREEPLPYGSLPPSAADTPGFVVGRPVELAQPAVQQPPATGLSDDVSARDSEYERMKQQYGPGADIYNTDIGQAMVQAAAQTQYEGDAAGLPGFYANQKQVGNASMSEVMSGLGIEEGSDMAAWAKAHPALALREYNKKMSKQPAPSMSADNQVITTAEDGSKRIGEGMYGYEPELDGPVAEPGAVREANTSQTAAAQPTEAQSGLRGKQMYDRVLALMAAAQQKN